MRQVNIKYILVDYDPFNGGTDQAEGKVLAYRNGQFYEVREQLTVAQFLWIGLQVLMFGLVMLACGYILARGGG